MTTFVIARNTFGEALRKRILWIFVIMTIALIALTVSFSQFTFREQLIVIRSLGLGLIAMVGLLIVLMLGINLMSVEIERRTIYTILSKPVRRHEFLLGKFFGAMLTLIVNLSLMSLVFVAMVTWKNNWHLELNLLKGTMMIFFELLIVGSVAMLFSVFTTPVVNFFLTSAVFIVGSLSDYTQSMASAENQSIGAKICYTVLHWATPQLGNYNIQNPLIHPNAVITSELRYYVINIIQALMWTAILLIISVLVFEKRDM